MIWDNHRCKSSARKTVRNEEQPCVIVARTLRAGECLTSDGCLNSRSTSRFPLTASAAREHVASLFVWNSFSKRQLTIEQKNGGRSQRKGKLVLVKRGGPSFFFFVKSYSFSGRFSCRTCPTTQQNSHVLLPLYRRCEWVAEFCALLSLTGSTGPDACCPFPDIERRRRHVWRFQVLCFVWFQMLKMTFGVVPHPTPKHTPQRTPLLCALTHTGR